MEVDDTETPGSAELSACILCYNDAPIIGEMIGAAGRALDRLGVAAEIVVVDDGSTDDSRERLRELASREPRLRVVEHTTNRGYGAAVRSAFGAARGEWVFYTDGDGQYDPSELALLAARADDDVDVVQGYKRERSDPLMRRVVGEVYRVVVGATFALRIRDIDCDFRLIRRSCLEQLDLKRSSGAICVELVRKLQDGGARFREVEVSHYERRAGESQFFTPRKVGRALVAVAWLWISLVAAPKLRSLCARLAGWGRSGPPPLATGKRGGDSGNRELDDDLGQPHDDRYGDRQLDGHLRAQDAGHARLPGPDAGREDEEEQRGEEPGRKG
jgi:glycosyltransferase involved in cell wall biosynthesis